MATDMQPNLPAGDAANPAVSPASRRAVALVVTVAALGYFVDIFDLLLFGLVRKTSLTEVLAPQLVGKTAEQVDTLLAEKGVLLETSCRRRACSSAASCGA